MKNQTFKLIVEVDYKDEKIGNCMYQGFFTVQSENFYEAAQKVIKWIDSNYGQSRIEYRINHINDYPRVNLD
jgi:hypothetical protein